MKTAYITVTNTTIRSNPAITYRVRVEGEDGHRTWNVKPEHGFRQGRAITAQLKFEGVSKIEINDMRAAA